MLDTLRKNSKSALIYVFFGIIIVVFVFSFGPGSSGCRSGMLAGGELGDAAVVNGKAITMTEYQQAYAQRFRDYQSRAGGAFTEQLAQSLGLGQQVLDGLIDRELMAQEAKRQGIEVSDRELAETIHKIPGFQVDGRFNAETYNRYLQAMATSAADFEDALRRDLLVQKLVAAVGGGAKVSDDEVRAQFTREKEKYDLAFVRFAPRLFKDQVEKATDAEIDAFLKDNAAKVEDFYKANKFRYELPKRVKARHILVKVAEGAPEAEVEAARKKAEELKQKIAGGADFAQVARESSDDAAHKEDGGDLGVVQLGTADPAIQQAAFALKAGEVSDPVRSADGFHLVKADEVLPEEKKELKQVEREIAAELVSEQKAKDLAKKKAEETLAEAKNGKPLEELWPAAAKPAEGELQIAPATAKPEVEYTGPFAPSGDYLPRIGLDAKLSKAIYGLGEQKKVLDQVYEINGTWYVVGLKSHEAADVSELAAKMDEYRERARQRKAGEVTDAYVKALREKANIQRNEALAAPANPAGLMDAE